MIERGWRSLKYECIYPNAFETGSEAHNGIGRWTAFHNEIRLHSSHGRLIPAETLAPPHRHRSVPETVCFSP
ncbi:integrase core domain-containing protein [Tritonibacter scottomollicae]|uniref:integrase core domain-containing protein n=1 Tax=Tritonibacter scottomollicae TaxID=483013 RepID=UPI003AA9C7CF